MSEQLDLSIALKKLHELGQAEGDLGCAYWYAVAQLLREAQGLAERIRTLEERGFLPSSGPVESMDQIKK
jgi:hypothetical protein